MTRLATTVDRIAALAFGVTLAAIGGGLLLWNTRLIPGIPETITAPGLVTAADTHWWPWAVAGVGILLVILALRWLLIHAPKARVKNLDLLTGDFGIISVDLGQLANAAARALKECPETHSAKGKAVIDRGVPTIDLTVTAYSPTAMTALIDGVDHVNIQLAQALGDIAIAVRTSVQVDNRKRSNRVT